jgi:hypothetical protein
LNSGENLLDETLAERIGGVDDVTLESIHDICQDALIAVVGPIAREILRQDPKLAERTVPWIWDLARGLHYQSIYGPAAPLTIELMRQLGFGFVDMQIQDAVADRIDLAFVLTEDRIAEYVQGHGAISRDPAERERAYPWYDRLRLGYRIHLVLEALRLMPEI